MAKINRKQKNRLLDELSENPLVTRACQKIGIHRSTFYRWCAEDLKFNTDVLTATERGRERISDFAESKLLENVSNNNQQAIAFLLRHNSRTYRPHAIKVYVEENTKLLKLSNDSAAIVNEIGKAIAIDMVEIIKDTHGPKDVHRNLRRALKAKKDTEDKL